MQPPSLCGVGMSPGHTGCVWLVGSTPTRTLLSSESARAVSALRCLKDRQEVLVTGADRNHPQECSFRNTSMQMMEIKCSWISRYEGPGPALQKVQVAQEKMLWTQEWPAHSSILPLRCLRQWEQTETKFLVPDILIFFQFLVSQDLTLVWFLIPRQYSDFCNPLLCFALLLIYFPVIFFFSSVFWKTYVIVRAGW